MTPPRRTPRTFHYQTSQPGSRGGSRYKSLFHVGFRHTYYDADQGRCPDLRAIPSPDCVNLLAKLGMVFKAEPAGFTVYFNESRVDDLVGYLRKQGDGTSGFWTRLTFLLQVVNLNFVSLTDLPITTNPNQDNIYACNSQAHDDGTAVRFCSGQYVGADDLYPVVGQEVSLYVPPNTRAVEVTDISGAVVLTAEPPPLNAEFPGDVTLNLSGLPLDLYTISVKDQAGGVGRSNTVVYTAGTPAPIGLLDVLLSQPQPDKGGVYPLPPLWTGKPITSDQVGDVDYTLPFDARATEWRYYIVSQIPGGRFTDLRIEGAGADFTQQQGPVLLPNGSPAVLFTSDSPIRLRRIPPQRFRLTGQRQNPDGSDQDIRVDCLPAAAAGPVWPGASPTTGVSEMYVHA